MVGIERKVEGIKVGALILRFLATTLPGLMKDLSAHLSCLAAPQRHKWTVISLTGLTEAANVLSEKLIKR